MSASRSDLLSPGAGGYQAREGRGCGADPLLAPREGSLHGGWTIGPQGLWTEGPKMLEQLPTPEDLGCGYQNKKCLSLWVLQSQILKALQGHGPGPPTAAPPPLPCPPLGPDSSQPWSCLWTQFSFPRCKVSRI